MRLYKSGTTWCVWRWTITDSEYITRLHLLKTPWFAICLHWINKPDVEPYLHDHPVSFLSIILRGGYTERRMINGGYGKTIIRRWFNFVSASRFDLHRITEVLPNTLTLVFMGPKVREWGFCTPGKWTHWKEYYAKQRLALAPIFPCVGEDPIKPCFLCGVASRNPSDHKYSFCQAGTYEDNLMLKKLSRALLRDIFLGILKDLFQRLHRDKKQDSAK